MSFIYKNEAAELFEKYNDFYSDYGSQLKTGFTLFKDVFELDFFLRKITINNNRPKTLYIPFKYKFLYITIK